MKPFIPDPQTAVAYLTRCVNKTKALQAINPAGADLPFGRTLARCHHLYSEAIEEIRTAGKVTSDVAFLVENVRDAAAHPFPMEIGAEIDAAAARIVESRGVRLTASAAVLPTVTVPTATTLTPDPMSKKTPTPIDTARAKVDAAVAMVGKPGYVAAKAEAHAALAALKPAGTPSAEVTRLRNVLGSDGLATFTAGLTLPTSSTTPIFADAAGAAAVAQFVRLVGDAPGASLEQRVAAAGYVTSAEVARRIGKTQTQLRAMGKNATPDVTLADGSQFFTKQRAQFLIDRFAK